MELPVPTTGVLLTCCAIQVTADAVSRVIHLPNGGDDRTNKLQARIGGRHLRSVAVYGRQPGDARSIMWFSDEQADSTPINVISAIIAVDRRPLVRGTVAFTGAVTPAGNITTVDHGLVEQIRDLTIAEYRRGRDREKTTRYPRRLGRGWTTSTRRRCETLTAPRTNSSQLRQPWTGNVTITGRPPGPQPGVVVRCSPLVTLNRGLVVSGP